MQPFKQVLIIGAQGYVGQLFSKLFSNPSFSEKIFLIDKKNPPENHSLSFIQKDILDPNFYDEISNYIKTSQCLILCLHEKETIAVVERYHHFFHKDLLIVDTLSVKDTYLSILKNTSSFQEGSYEVLSIDPLFKPQENSSLEKKILFLSLREGEKSLRFITALESIGLKLIFTDLENLNERMAIVQCLPHILLFIFGRVLSQKDFSSPLFHDWETPLFRGCLALLARFSSGSSLTYWDIQQSNSHRKEIFRMIRKQLDDLEILLDNKKETIFSTQYENLSSLFPQDYSQYLSLFDTLSKNKEN